MECASVLHQPDGIGSMRYHIVAYGELNGIPVALVDRFGVISKSTDGILVSHEDSRSIARICFDVIIGSLEPPVVVGLVSARDVMGIEDRVIPPYSDIAAQRPCSKVIALSGGRFGTNRMVVRVTHRWCEIGLEGSGGTIIHGFLKHWGVVLVIVVVEEFLRFFVLNWNDTNKVFGVEGWNLVGVFLLKFGEFVLDKIALVGESSDGCIRELWRRCEERKWCLRMYVYKVKWRSGLFNGLGLYGDLGLEYGRYGVSKVLDTAYWGFLGVGTAFDIFQNIIFPYSLNMAYWSSWIWRIGSCFLHGLWCRHRYAISSLMDTAYWLSEQ
ncbi:hypothetical protein Tco_0268996 [Tanacetum coccineum]